MLMCGSQGIKPPDDFRHTSLEAQSTYPHNLKSDVRLILGFSTPYAAEIQKMGAADEVSGRDAVNFDRYSLITATSLLRCEM